MKIAVYNVPPNPRSENGASALSDFKEHKGNSAMVVIANITFDREVNTAGKPKVLASDVKESPIMIEYAKEARKHLAVIPAEMTQAVFGLTDLAQAS